jgi:hypothetical protein
MPKHQSDAAALSSVSTLPLASVVLGASIQFAGNGVAAASVVTGDSGLCYMDR